MTSIPPVLDLRVVPLESIHRHEEIDPFRVGRLMERVGTEGVQVNPMVCAEAADGTLVLLDGATRTEALMKLGLEHAVVQVVGSEQVTLETWHHVVRSCPADRIIDEIVARPELALADLGDPPRVHVMDSYSSVSGVGVSPNAVLSALVDTYMGKWTVSRVVDPSIETVAPRFQDWSVVVEFPTLSIEDVIEAAVTKDLLPAGITRFLVDDRALRVNISLDLLRSLRSADEKQGVLDRLIEERASEGRVRRYEEPVYVLDD